ncbi:antA/AntB antirepressor family protein [Duganella phyllosphaerae]|uniref:AntA/AntB antirepressor n=1 Tax=Duganella phyllosphaerae TaxID=762836 RepID=A0A1E7W4S2_9BURK|nr:antA/AntB antirepressor family protein [Duganella phyllosphaerae]OEZ90698.1 AntA/AntB antirepressor [Duganella phyllosphaerae]
MSAYEPHTLLARQPASDIARLVPVRTAMIGGKLIQSVSARELHAYLNVGKLFAAWMPERIAQYGFFLQQDYEVFSDSGNNPAGGRPSKEYTITLDMAKELSMVERNAKGKEARQYFIECERRALAPAVDQLASLPPEQRALIALMVDNASIKARQDEHAQALAGQAEVQAQQGATLTQVEQRVDELADTMVVRTRPAGSESITHMRPRAAKMFGLPERIVEYLVRQSPLQIKPACMVKNDHEDAEGGSYAVYWVKDVNAVLRRFTAECQMVTPSFATHPYVEGRFKLTPARDRP